jgi:hypothetical protein
MLHVAPEGAVLRRYAGKEKRGESGGKSTFTLSG